MTIYSFIQRGKRDNAHGEIETPKYSRVQLTSDDAMGSRIKDYQVPEKGKTIWINTFKTDHIGCQSL